MTGLLLAKAKKTGGSVGYPVNSCMALNLSDDLITTDETSQWLKTGVVIDSTDGYPDATTFVDHYVDNNAVYNVATGDTGGDMAWDGTHWWHYEDANYVLKQYDADFVPTGTVKNTVANVGSQCIGFCTDGKYLYVGNYSNRRVYYYDIATLTYQGAIILSGFNNLFGLSFDGEYFYSAGTHSTSNSGYMIKQYNANWEFTGVEWHIGHTDSSGQVRGFTYSPETKNLYVAASGKKVTEWTREGVYVRTYEFTQMPSGGVYGLSWKDGVLYGLCYSDDKIYTAKPVRFIGSPTAYADENGVPIFTRIR